MQNATGFMHSTSRGENIGLYVVMYTAYAVSDKTECSLMFG